MAKHICEASPNSMRLHGLVDLLINERDIFFDRGGPFPTADPKYAK